MSLTRSGIGYDRAGPIGAPRVLLVHAGIADRRMWEPIWGPLSADHELVRLDLRGFGESARRPSGALDPVADVREALDTVGWPDAHVVAASYGAGVAVELALDHPRRVTSLLLLAPGGSLIEGRTPQFTAFLAEEEEALGRGDLDAAADADVRWWVDGPHRGADVVPGDVRRLVHAMQRRAFELTADWDDLEEVELHPPALDRLGEVRAATLVLRTGLDIDAIGVAADRVAAGIPGARTVTWDDVAHLPTLERPQDAAALIRDWVHQRAR